MKESFLKVLWRNLLTLILLNLAFIASCAGVVTIPAAGVGLCRGVQCCLRGDNGALREYGKAFRGSILCALPVGLLFGVLLIASAYGCLFYRQNFDGRFILLPLSVFCLIVLLLSHGAMIYAFNMVAAVELPTGKLIKNAFLLLVVDVRHLLTWPMLSAAILLINVLLFPRTLPLLLLLTFSVSALCGARGAIPVIEQYITEDDNE